MGRRANTERQSTFYACNVFGLWENAEYLDKENPHSDMENMQTPERPQANGRFKPRTLLL